MGIPDFSRINDTTLSMIWPHSFRIMGTMHASGEDCLVSSPYKTLNWYVVDWLKIEKQRSWCFTKYEVELQIETYQFGKQFHSFALSLDIATAALNFDSMFWIVQWIKKTFRHLSREDLMGDVYAWKKCGIQIQFRAMNRSKCLHRFLTFGSFVLQS